MLTNFIKQEMAEGESGMCESAHFMVTAYDSMYGGDLVVAIFPWDATSPDASHHRRMANDLANKFVPHPFEVDGFRNNT